LMHKCITPKTAEL